MIWTLNSVPPEKRRTENEKKRPPTIGPAGSRKLKIEISRRKTLRDKTSQGVCNQFPIVKS